MIYYVAANARPGGDGSEKRPFATISQAAALAVPGDTVLVGPAIYREWVDPRLGGAGENQRITYRSAVPGGAVISAAEEVKSWEPYGDNVWLARIPNSLFTDRNPYTTLISGDWYEGKEPVHTGEVFLNDRAMYETPALENVLHPTVYKPSWEPERTLYKWYTCQEGNETLIYANFQGLNPNEENVEISARQACFYPSREGVGYITLSGFVICKAAPKWAPPTAYQEGMVGPHWSKGWIIEDCEIYGSRCSGISLGKYLQPHNENRWSLWGLKNGTHMERNAILQAQRDGWSKETVGSHIVRRCNIHHCGQTGIVGHLGGVFSRIEENHIHHINNKQDLAGAEIGGIKMHGAIDVLFRRNHIHHCTRGLWLDWQAQGSHVTGNLFHDNTPPYGTEIPGALCWGEDLFVEVSHGPTLVDHNIMLSDCAVRLSTQGVAFAHNLIAGSITYVGIGTDDCTDVIPSPRFTPYHVPHGTDVVGFAFIHHGDNRFYNNLFIQQPIRDDLAAYTRMEGTDFAYIQLTAGTHPFNDYPTEEEYLARHEKCREDPEADQDRYYDHLPVWTGGNVFLSGARPCSKEQDYFLDAAARVELTLSEDGSLFTDLYRLLPEMDTQVVDTALLGYAYEPEQPYEGPNGEFLTLDRDFFGALHEAHPLPGPFHGAGTCFDLRLPGFDA